jgi:phosphatidylinositol kinase/protein kinase (PI-3  family)
MKHSAIRQQFQQMFDTGFVSCWLDIDEAQQQELVRSLEAALASPSIPPEIVTALLNLAEFMEHDERPLPLDTRTLGALAEKCHAFAKVLINPTLACWRVLCLSVCGPSISGDA